jgi:hypothetical protein
VKENAEGEIETFFMTFKKLLKKVLVNELDGRSGSLIVCLCINLCKLINFYLRKHSIFKIVDQTTIDKHHEWTLDDFKCTAPMMHRNKAVYFSLSLFLPHVSIIFHIPLALRKWFAAFLLHRKTYWPFFTLTFK